MWDFQVPFPFSIIHLLTEWPHDSFGLDRLARGCKSISTKSYIWTTFGAHLKLTFDAISFIIRKHVHDSSIKIYQEFIEPPVYELNFNHIFQKHFFSNDAFNLF